MMDVCNGPCLAVCSGSKFSGAGLRGGFAAVDKRRNQVPGRARVVELRASAFLKWSRWLPLVIVVGMAVLAWLDIREEARAVSALKQRIREENLLRMQSSEEHVNDYLEEVYSMLLFISEDDDVIAMRTQARGFIQKVYDHGWEYHQLAELYVVERDFNGEQRPFMTFEHESGSLPSPQVHSAAREQEEYRTQMEQIQRFAADPGLRALFSHEIALCVPDAQGRQARGFVYSVPIHSGKSAGGHRRGHDPDPHDPGVPA